MALGGFALGLVLLVCTALIWTGTSFVSEALVRGQGTFLKGQSMPPLLLTFLGTSLFTLYLPGVHLKLWIQECMARRRARRSASAGSMKIAADPEEVEADVQRQESEARRAALRAAPLWFLAQLAFNTSLMYTSVTSNSILSSSSSLFTYGMSVLILRESYTWRKLACCGACIAGTVLVTVADGNARAAPRASDAGSGTVDSDPSAPSPGLRVLGDVLVLVSSALYAAYTIALRKALPGEESAQQVAFFFGYVGLFATVLASPFVVTALGLGYIDLSQIPTQMYWIILLEGIFDYALADFLWAQAVLLLGPTVAALGISIGIPLATIVDLVIGTPAWISSAGSIALTLGGTLLILLGFFGVNLGQQQKEQEELMHQHERLQSHEDSYGSGFGGGSAVTHGGSPAGGGKGGRAGARASGLSPIKEESAGHSGGRAGGAGVVLLHGQRGGMHGGVDGGPQLPTSVGARGSFEVEAPAGPVGGGGSMAPYHASSSPASGGLLVLPGISSDSFFAPQRSASHGPYHHGDEEGGSRLLGQRGGAEGGGAGWAKRVAGKLAGGKAKGGSNYVRLGKSDADSR